MRYFWHYKGETLVLGESDDPWELIQQAVSVAKLQGKVSDVRVGVSGAGPMKPGRFPLPLEWEEGEWGFGSCSDFEVAANICYGELVGWSWWALGKIGDADTLQEAMKAADAIIQPWLYGDEERP